MIVMVCVDDKNGMMFNKRRQSQDRVLRQHMLELAGDKKLWMNAYSRKQFPKEDESRIAVAENGFQNIRSGEYCFLEDKDPAQYKEQIEELILFHWNRTLQIFAVLWICRSENRRQQKSSQAALMRRSHRSGM